MATVTAYSLAFCFLLILDLTCDEPEPYCGRCS